MRSLSCFVVVTLVLLSPAARAEQRWLLADPVTRPVTKVWAEGTIEPRREDGRSMATLTTNGKGNPTLAALQGLDPVVDARGRFAQAVLRVRGVEHLAGIEVRFSSDGMQASWLSLPVLLYGDREYNFVQEDTWAPITLSFGTAVAVGSPDRQRIDSVGIMVTDDGKGKVEVDLAGIALVDAPKQGVVSFTFDDGYKEHVVAARMLAERSFRGTFYVIPQLVGTHPAYLTEADVAEIGARLRRRGARRSAVHADPACRARAARGIPNGSRLGIRGRRAPSRIRSASRSRSACGRRSRVCSRRRASREAVPRRSRRPIHTCYAPST
jgi:hypothetical protein